MGAMVIVQLIGRVVGRDGLAAVDIVRGMAAGTGDRAAVATLELAQEAPHGARLAHVEGMGHVCRLARGEGWRGQVGVLGSPCGQGVDGRDERGKDPGLTVLGEGGLNDRVDVSGDPEHCLKSVGKFHRPVKICSEVDLLAVPLALETSFNLRKIVEKKMLE